MDEALGRPLQSIEERVVFPLFVVLGKIKKIKI